MNISPSQATAGSLWWPPQCVTHCFAACHDPLCTIASSAASRLSTAMLFKSGIALYNFSYWRVWIIVVLLTNQYYAV